VIRSAGILVLLALVALIAGMQLATLCGILWRRFQKKRPNNFQLEEKFDKIQTVKSSTTIPMNIGIVEAKIEEQEALKLPVDNRPNTPAALERSSETDVNRESIIISQDTVKIAQGQKELPKSDIFAELETNFAIASTPGAEKLVQFQTTSWESTRGEGEPLLKPHLQEVIQLYVDIGLANNIVWLTTEFGHRNTELDESYAKLSVIIKERLQRLLSSVSST
jgi:hypothetical protein